ncbi:uncharacterized protein LOC111712379 [Eurytemora carolleeae]|uniref:uncharacterized protein LOC111712379 n=1 Tax=Eurytemora carolleeae TaxID=1294199 RepID=UPI000C759560|nr:uncharacterized protein LOC111712379 [Eurytemora carolleeae]|eukprot:XP_023342735.1 uncharacterized protein LOC111712379 [Eurytemora affinis]
MLLFLTLVCLAVAEPEPSALYRNYIQHRSTFSRLPVPRIGGLGRVSSLAREQGALITEQFFALQDNKCLARGLCQFGAMSEKGILDTIKEYEIPNLTLDDLWSLVNETIHSVSNYVQGGDDEDKRQLPTVDRLLGAVKVGKLLGYDSCKSLFDCSEDLFRNQQGRITCQGAGVICPGLSISCAMCGLYAPATCGAACTAAGLYCGFGGYACADAAAAAAAEAAAGPAVFK